MSSLLPFLAASVFLLPGQDTEVPGELARQIGEAVDRGVLWLRERQEKNGSFRFTAMKQDIYAEHPVGETSLSMMALLAAGVPREDPAVTKALEYVLRTASRDTYTQGLTLMALDMLGAPPWERRALEKMSPQERKQYAFPRMLGARERARMEEDLAQLLKSWGGGYWSYGMKSGPHGDISNTQFALLGLKAASRCGFDVPVSIYDKTLQVFLGTQSRLGLKTVLPLASGDPDKPGGYFIEYSAEARGWSYWHGNYGASENEVTGSRTNIGVACIALCRDEIFRKGDTEALDKLQAKEDAVKDALLDGLAWIHANYSVEKNPGTEEFRKKAPWPVNGAWYYYYLYSIERTGAFLHTRWIGRRDWYREGAEALLKKQEKNGSWLELNPLVDTCFALLFLRKASTPSVYTAPRDFAR